MRIDKDYRFETDEGKASLADLFRGRSQLLVYQVAREALNNSARHSRASRIEVRLWKENGLIRLTVADDGIGFDPVLVDREAHFGLQLIVERMEAASGRVVIDSRLGQGTTVTAAMPPDIT